MCDATPRDHTQVQRGMALTTIYHSDTIVEFVVVSARPLNIRCTPGDPQPQHPVPCIFRLPPRQAGLAALDAAGTVLCCHRAVCAHAVVPRLRAYAACILLCSGLLHLQATLPLWVCCGALVLHILYSATYKVAPWTLAFGLDSHFAPMACCSLPVGWYDCGCGLAGVAAGLAAGLADVQVHKESALFAWQLGMQFTASTRIGTTRRLCFVDWSHVSHLVTPLPTKLICLVALALFLLVCAAVSLQRALFLSQTPCWLIAPGHE